MTSSGMPMSAMTTSPARVSAGGSTSGSLGAASVTVSAGLDRRSPIGSCESADRPDGRSIDDDRNARRVDVGDDRLEQAATAARSGRCRRSRRRSATQSLTSEKCSSHAWLSAISTTVRPRRPRISRLMRASPRTSATRPIRNTDTSTPRCSSVRATTKPSPPLLPRPQRTATWPLEQIAVRSLRSPPPPGGRRSPSARATGCRSLRSCGDRLRASARESRMRIWRQTVVDRQVLSRLHAE